MRVVKQLSDRIDGRAGNSDAGERVVPVRDGILRNRGLDMAEGFLAVRYAVSIRFESRIIDDGVQCRYSAELAPKIVVRDPDHDRAIGSLEGLIRAKRFVARSAFRRLNTALPKCLQIVPEEAQGGFEEGDPDRTSPPRPFPPVPQP